METNDSKTTKTPSMKWYVLSGAAAASLVGAAITFAIIRWLNKGDPELSFIVGSIIGIQVAAFWHTRTVGAQNTLLNKALLGIVLALTTAALGFMLHQLYEPFKFADISIGMSTLGSFIFPFVLYNTFWKALAPRNV